MSDLKAVFLLFGLLGFAKADLGIVAPGITDKQAATTGSR